MRTHKKPDQVGVELGASVGDELFVGRLHGAMIAVSPPSRDGIDGIDDRHNAGDQGNFSRMEAVGITEAIDSLVMMSDPRKNGAEKWNMGEGSDDLDALFGMRPHDRFFAFGKGTLFAQNLFGDPNFSDVMQEAGELSDSLLDHA